MQERIRRPAEQSERLFFAIRRLEAADPSRHEDILARLGDTPPVEIVTPFSDALWNTAELLEASADVQARRLVRGFMRIENAYMTDLESEINFALMG